MATKKTAIKKDIETPETIKPVIKETEKSLKIKMIHTFISNDYLLKEGNEYEILNPLASLLILNGDAQKC